MTTRRELVNEIVEQALRDRPVCMLDVSDLNVIPLLHVIERESDVRWRLSNKPSECALGLYTKHIAVWPNGDLSILCDSIMKVCAEVDELTFIDVCKKIKPKRVQEKNKPVTTKTETEKIEELEELCEPIMAWLTDNEPALTLKISVDEAELYDARTIKTIIG